MLCSRKITGHVLRGRGHFRGQAVPAPVGWGKALRLAANRGYARMMIPMVPPNLRRGKEGSCVCWNLGEWDSGSGRGIPRTQWKLESPHFPFPRGHGHRPGPD